MGVFLRNFKYVKNITKLLSESHGDSAIHRHMMFAVLAISVLECIVSKDKTKFWRERK